MLNINAKIDKIEPIANEIPGKYKVELDFVKKVNEEVIIKGPIIAVKLIKLVKPPCNSPCSLLGTFCVIILWIFGIANPPNMKFQYNLLKL